MIEAATLITLLNDAAVSIFGGLLSASFCGIFSTRKNCRIFWVSMILMLIPQGAVCFFWSADFQRRMYPLILHLPLLILLYILTGKRLWPTISLLSAYLFCQMRRWLALLAAAVLPGAELTQKLAELAFTLPLLLILLRFIAPAIRQLANRPVRTQCQFGLIPALYYGFDYLTRIYTDLLSSGSPVVVEFMPTVCCAAYLVFLLYNSAEERRHNLLQQMQDNLQLQMSQAAREISDLRESQAMTVKYRHDLRHHLQYLLSCIENGQSERAKSYISGICAELEAQQVRRYCENEAVNLILAAFVKRAERAGIQIDIRGALPSVVSISDNDLCVILSNALENALHACLPIAVEGTDCTISVEFRFRTQSGRLFLQIINPCREEVRFEKGIPVSGRPGHGIGVQSIRALVARYGGDCQFLLEDDRFILRLFL
ncbi:MAG: GHKL domain-containing protein [Lachnospiraceae bacterium]|nr:GHKL domain-containing protein [Lachnospiraceae bacterium]